MGAEAKCIVEVRGLTHEGVALLETDELLFRGPVRLKIPLRTIDDVRASDGRLVVRHAGEDAVFVLGDAAPRWAEKIRSPKTLVDKLGVKAGQRVSVVGVTDEAFLQQLAGRTHEVVTGRFAKGSDIVFLCASSVKELDRLRRALESIVADGAIWVVHPKGKGALKDTEIFDAATKIGLTYTKVVRFSETHTAEKLVIPVSQRGGRTATGKRAAKKTPAQSSRGRR